MRAVLALVVIGAILGAAGLAVWLLRGLRDDARSRALQAARWVDFHHTKDEITYVGVHKIAIFRGETLELERQLVREISTTARDYTQQLFAARAEAWSRAIDLNNPSLMQ